MARQNFGHTDFGHFDFGHENLDPSVPVINFLTITEVETRDPERIDDFHLDVEWEVEDEGGDLKEAFFRFVDLTDEETESTFTDPISGGSADNGNRPFRFVAFGDNGLGHTYRIELKVIDKGGRMATATADITESEPSSPPEIDSISINEPQTDGTPNAEFDVSVSASDVNDDLDKVEVTLRDDTEGVDEETVTDTSIGGGSASPTIRVVAAGDDGTEHDYTATAVLTDEAGLTASKSVSITESDTTVEPLVDASISFSDAKAEWDNAPNPTTAWPSNQNYLRELIRWLNQLENGTGTDKDIATNGAGPVTFDENVTGINEDRLYILWLIFTDTRDLPTNDHLRYDDNRYIPSTGYLNGSTAGEPKTVMAPINGPKNSGIQLGQGALFTQLDAKGLDNPYGPAVEGTGGAYHENAKRKIMSAAINEMIMFEWLFRTKITRDIGSGAMNRTLAGWRDCVRAFRFCNDVLDDATKYAFVRAGWEVWREISDTKYPWVNENMSTFGLGGSLQLWRYAKDLDMVDSFNYPDEIKKEFKEVIYSRRDGAASSSNPNDNTNPALIERFTVDQYEQTGLDQSKIDNNNGGLSFDEGRCLQYGAINESGGPHSAYFGNVPYFFMEGYSAVAPFLDGEFAFFKERMRRANEWIGDLIAHDYEGGDYDTYTAPTQFSNRTAYPMVREESAAAGRFVFYLSQYLDECGVYLSSERGNVVPPDKATMKADISNNIDLKYGWGKITSRGFNNWWEREKGTSNDDSRNTYDKGSFDTGRWGTRPGDRLWDLMPEGIYQNVQDWKDQDVAKSVYERGDFVRAYKDEIRVKQTASNGRQWAAVILAPEFFGREENNGGILQQFWADKCRTVFSPDTNDYLLGPSAWGQNLTPWTKFNFDWANGSTDFFRDGPRGPGTAKPSRSWNRGTLSNGLPFIERSFKKSGIVFTARAETGTDGIKMSYTVNPDSSLNADFLRMEWPVFRATQKTRDAEEFNGPRNIGTFDSYRTRVEWWNGSWNTLTRNREDGQNPRSARYLRLSRDMEQGAGRGYVYMDLFEQKDVIWLTDGSYLQEAADGNFPFWGKWQWPLELQMIDPQTISSPISFSYKIGVTDPT